MEERCFIKERFNLWDQTTGFNRILWQAEMSSSSCVFSEEQFLCSICLDVFTDPVTIPCGHNFCKNCISHHWGFKYQYKCPLCAKVFHTRPELHVNTFISGVADEVRQWAVIRASRLSAQRSSACGEVLLHHNIPDLTQHEPTDPVEVRTCEIHDRPLEMFCKTDQRCVCISCARFGHLEHHLVALKTEYEQKKKNLEKDEVKLQQKIQERELKMEQIKQSQKFSQEDSGNLTTASVQVFTPLIRSAEKGLAQLLDSIEKKHKKTEKQAEGFIGELEEEISELMRRSVRMEQLLHTEDHLQFLQNLSSMSPAPLTKDWTGVKVHSSYDGAVRSAVVQLRETLLKEIKQMCVDVDLKRVQQYAADVTLDPDTAHPYLTLTKNKKKVYYGKKQKLPYKEERFSKTCCVLGKESFSAGRFYFEVQVKGKKAFDLGVALGSIDRKHLFKPSSQADLWVLSLRGHQYAALSGSLVLLSLKSKPQKVGVFVHYEEGLISFYDVDTAALIHCFTGCNFTDKLFPIFGPCNNSSGDNSAPLVITPVNQTVQSRF